ncbi:hypothetical protein KUTeg_005983 [Tegillarca granosa]|uniref:Uncharacterized protein n=1 Tax=Tegillarca granosa TaxID=220873 RepID=A0ABQ9FF75_TEGGR|nr:hypothetical protein KUTeg_005983 [Tegillarca granosa]
MRCVYLAKGPNWITLHSERRLRHRKWTCT